MKYIIVIAATLFLFSPCYTQSEAEKLIDKSIQFHDPDGNWGKFSSLIRISSIVERDGKRTSSERRLIMDLHNENFEMEWEKEGYGTAKVYKSKKTCGGEVLGQKISADSLKTAGITCDRAKMYNNYFQYLLGLPMKLKDPGTIIDPEVTTKTYRGRKYKVAKVTYDPKVGKDTWLFYFDNVTAELVLCEFSKDGTFENGETIELNNKRIYDGMRLPGQLIWLVLPYREFLAEENITYTGI